MAEECNFIVISKINELSMENLSPMSIAFSYPILALCVTSSKIVIFNIEHREGSIVERKTPAPVDSVVLCSAISNDLQYLITGHSDGEIVLWQISNGQIIVTTQVPEFPSFICFSSNSSTFVYADSNGLLYKCQVVTSIFKKAITVLSFFNFEAPLTALASNQNFIFASSSVGTTVFNSQQDFSILWSDQDCASCFAFRNIPNSQTFLVARGVDHNVIITDQYDNDRRNLLFGGTPLTISMMANDSILVLFKGSCEMIVAGRRFKKTVPNGIALSNGDRIFIANDKDFLQLTLASVKDRVDEYISEGNWAMVFDQIQSPDDVPDLGTIFLEYIHSDKFEPDILIKAAERLQFCDFVISQIHEKKLLTSFIDSNISNWRLTLDFVMAAIDNCNDNQKIISFLTTNELKLDWIESIFNVCIKRNLLDVISTISQDYFINPALIFKIDELSHNYESIFARLDALFIGQDPSPSSQNGKFIGLFKTTQSNISSSQQKFNQNAAINWLIQAYLPSLLDFDINHSNNIFSIIISDFGNDPRMLQLICHLSEALPISSPLWINIGTFFLKNRFPIVKIYEYTFANAENIMNNIDAFIFTHEGDGDIREQLLLWHISSYLSLKANDSTISVKVDLKRYTQLSRAVHFEKAEFEIIKERHSLDDLITYLITYKKESFDKYMSIVEPNISNQQIALLKYSKLFFIINPDEYCNRIFTMLNNLSSSDENSIQSEGDAPSFFHKIAKSLSAESDVYYNFLKRMFAFPDFILSISEEEIIDYIIFLIQYHPDKVYPMLRTLQNIPVDKLLKFCQSNGIVDATLYLCKITHDIDRGVNFGTLTLQDYLMAEPNQELCSSVISQIATFLSDCRNEKNINEIWLKFLKAFQMPIYYFLFTKPDHDRFVVIRDLLLLFIHSMILSVDSVDAAKSVTQYFAFVPFVEARPILVSLFKVIHEKNQFSATFAQIVKNEAVVKQNARIHSTACGNLYDAERCPNCGKFLGQGDAFAAPCGHVMHVECAQNHWCQLCQCEFDPLANTLSEVQYTSQEFSEKESHFIPKPLAAPKIGTVVDLSTL